MKNLLFPLLLTIFSTYSFATDYLSISPANNMPNENGQFIFTPSGDESFNKTVYINVSSIGSLPSKDGQFIVYPSNPCTNNCKKTDYISTNPANNMPNESGQFIYSSL